MKKNNKTSDYFLYVVFWNTEKRIKHHRLYRDMKQATEARYFDLIIVAWFYTYTSNKVLFSTYQPITNSVTSMIRLLGRIPALPPWWETLACRNHSSVHSSSIHGWSESPAIHKQYTWNLYFFCFYIFFYWQYQSYAIIVTQYMIIQTHETYIIQSCSKNQEVWNVHLPMIWTVS